MLDKIRDCFLGLAVGDALGVPVEFSQRNLLAKNPVTNMRAYGTHQQAAGTWSDDSSLTFCLAESLIKGFNLSHLAHTFISWKRDAYWSARGQVFDIGIATAKAINKLAAGTEPHLAGGSQAFENGNGSLMRIAPMAFFCQHLPIEVRFEQISLVSSLTHAHIQSRFACFIWVEFLIQLLNGKEKFEAYQNTQIIANQFINEYLLAKQICTKEELAVFSPILNQENSPIYKQDKTNINSSGYVMHTLEASFWCFLNFDSFEAAVLEAVNLGEDTDTTACVVGAAAGIYFENIPENWLNQLARKEDIINLAERFGKSLI